MEKTKTKIIKQKMIIVPMMIIILFNFVFPNYSQASIEGVLVSPVTGLLAVIGDAINRVINATIGTETSDNDTLSDEAAGVVSSLIGTGDNEIYIDDEEKMAKYIQNNPAKDSLPVVKMYEEGDIMGDYGIPNIKITSAEIFSNKVALLNANYFTTDYDNSIGGEGRSAVKQLKETVSGWYQTLRRIALVGLLSVLVYIGIRIILASAAADKAKYKERAKDWLIAMCLVFFLHYIMVATMTIVDEITDALGGGELYTKQVNIEVHTGERPTSYTDGSGNVVDDSDTLDEVDGTPVKFSTNLVGYMRLCVEAEDAMPKLAAVVMYLALTFYTIYFVFIYLKRLLTLTFLTMIAPLIALTYPLDKLKDSKAQAFNFWLREYIMNAMLPIIHFILYTILVSSAANLVANSPLYAICALAFIVPAEKLVKDMFGFKSNTAPGGGFAGGALAASLLSSRAKKAPGGGGGAPNKTDSSKIKTYADKGRIDSSYSDLALGAGEGAGEGSSGGQTTGNNTRTMTAGGYSAEEQMANMNAGQDEMHNWDTEPASYSAEEQMANLDAGQDEMHNWNAEPASYSAEEQMANLDAGQDEMHNWNAEQSEAERRANYNPNLSGIGETTDNAARELRESSKVRQISNNAKNMVAKKYRAAGGAKGIAARAAKKAGKKAIRAAIKAPTMLTGAALGLAGGIVSGDLKDVWKGMAGGAVAGNIMGGKLANKVENTFGGISGRHTLDELRYGEAEADARARRREIVENKNNIKYWEDKNPRREGESNKAYMERRKKDLENMSEYSEAAGGNIKKMDRLYKLEKSVMAERGMPTELRENATEDERKKYTKEKQNAQRYAEQIAKLSEQYKASDLVGSKKNDVINEHKNKLMAAGLNEESASLRATKIVSQIKEYNKWA